MKILQLTNKPIVPTNDGGTMAMKSLSTSITDLGYELHVFSLYSDKHPKDDSKCKELLPQIKFHHAYVDSLPSIVGTVNHGIFKKEYHAKRFYNTKVEHKLSELISGQQFDVVIFDNPFMLNYMKAVKSVFNGKIVYRSHNVEYKLWEDRAKQETFFKKKLLLRLAKELKSAELDLIKNVDEIWSISKSDMKNLEKITSIKQYYVPFGYPSQDIEIKENQKLAVGFIGALDWEPNVEGLNWFIQKVWPEVRKKNPELELHIAGRNSSQDFGDESQNIHFHGEVEDAIAFMRDYPIQIAPLFTGSGIRIKILEAMSIGLPIITTKIGAQGFEDTSGLLIKDEEKQFAQAILEVIGDDKKRRSLMELSQGSFKKYHDISTVNAMIADRLNAG